MLGSTYQANLQIMQTTASFVDPPRDHARRPHHPCRRLAARREERPPCSSATRAAAGKATRSSSTRRTYTDRTPFRGPPATTRQDIFTSRDLHVTERFTRTDADTIVYRFTVDDPATFGQAVVGRDGDADDGGPAVRVRLPRRQLRPGEHPQRRTRRREVSRRPDRTMKTTPHRCCCCRRRLSRRRAASRAEQGHREAVRLRRPH